MKQVKVKFNCYCTVNADVRDCSNFRLAQIIIIIHFNVLKLLKMVYFWNKTTWASKLITVWKESSNIKTKPFPQSFTTLYPTLYCWVPSRETMGFYHFLKSSGMTLLGFKPCPFSYKRDTLPQGELYWMVPLTYLQQCLQQLLALFSSNTHPIVYHNSFKDSFV